MCSFRLLVVLEMPVRYLSRTFCDVRITGLLCLALLGSMNWANWTTAADPIPANRKIQSEVRALLIELDANQRTRRQKAEKDLLDLGPQILSVLPPPELLPNQAVRSAVARVRVTLERRKAQGSVQASQVSMPSTRLSLGDWLKQVETQTANHIDAAAVPNEVLQSQVEPGSQSVPFWLAMERVNQDKHLRYLFDPQSSVLKLVPESESGADDPWLATASGPFRIGVNWVRPRKVTGDPRFQRLRTELTVAPEPRLRALFLKMAANDFQARGPRGTIFPAADAAAQFDLPLGEGGRYVRWNLDFLASSELREADIFPMKIEGQASMQIAAGSEHIRFTDLVGGEGTARRRGGVTVSVQRIKSATAEDGTLSVSIKVLVVYDAGGPAFESHRTWIFHNEVYLDRDEGDPVSPNGGFNTDLQANGSVGVTYRFEGLKGSLDDYQFVYVAPTLIVDVPFKIELDGVKGPEKR